MDPLSVSGTAVGVVSLGLTVAQGLLSYYGAWDTYHTDLDAMKQNLELFKATLQSLNNYLLQTTGPSVSVNKINVENVVLSCSGNITKLNAMLSDCRTNQAPQNTKEKVEILAQRLLYPFRRSTLKDMSKTIDDLQLNLTTALQVMELDVLGVLSSHQDASDSKNLAALDRINDNLLVAIPHISKTAGEIEILHTDTRTISAVVGSCEGKLRKLEQDIEAIHRGMSQNTFSTASILSALKTRDTIHAETSNFITDDNMPQRFRRKGQSLRCSCLFPSYTRSKYWVGPLLFFRHKHTSHNSKCPLAPLALRTDRFKLRLLFGEYILSGLLDFSFTLTRGAGGLSVAPSLTYRGILSDNNLAVRILRRYPLRFSSQSYCHESEITTETIIHLTKAWEGQESSPWATDRLGNNLLHLAADLVRFVDLKQPDTFGKFRAVFQHLIGLGVSASEVNEDGRTPLDIVSEWYMYLYSDHFLAHTNRTLIDKNLLTYNGICEALPSQRYADFGNWLNDGGRFRSYSMTERVPPEAELIDQGALMSFSSLSMVLVDAGATATNWCNIKTCRDLLLVGGYMRQIVRLGCPSEVFEGSDLLKAVLLRSTNDLVSILKISPDSVYEKDRWQHNCLHLGVLWPEGLQILLDHKVDPNEHSTDNESPLGYAFILNCPESVELLISHGSQIDKRILEACIISSDERMEDTVVSGLYHRREALRRLVQDRMPSVKLTPGIVLDCEAHSIWNLLVQSGQSPDPSLCVREDWSVYGVKCLTVRIAAKLYSIGFHDTTQSVLFNDKTLPSLRIYSMESFKVSQLLLKGKLRLVSWLLPKTDLQQIRLVGHRGCRPSSHWRTTSLHLYGARISQHVQCQGFRQRIDKHTVHATLQPDDDFRHAVERIFTENIRDDCDCLCSDGGCSPFSVVLRTKKLHTYWLSHEDFDKIRAWILQWLSGFLGSDHLAWEFLKPAIIRFETFTALKSRHTCCELAENSIANYLVNKNAIIANRSEKVDAMERIIRALDLDSSRTGRPFTHYLSRTFHFRLQQLIKMEFPNGLDHDGN